VATLKELNNMIRNASNLRVGVPAKRVVAEARECIKNSEHSRIAMVLQKGASQ
jgi:hypothetical protein